MSKLDLQTKITLELTVSELHEIQCALGTTTESKLLAYIDSIVDEFYEEFERKFQEEKEQEMDRLYDEYGHDREY